MSESVLDARRMGLVRPVDVVAAPRARLVGAAVFLGCLAVFILGNHAQFWDRDEPRYAEATRAMLHSGDFVVPHHNGEWRLSKPVGIYWLQAASMSLMGENEFAARFPSALFLALAAWLLLHALWRFTGRLRPGLIAAAAFAGCLMTQYQAHAATIDASLLLVVTAMMLLWFSAMMRARVADTPEARGANASRWVGFYVLGAVGVLLKMPVIVAVWTVTAMAFAIWNWSDVRHMLRPRPMTTWWPHVLGIVAGFAVSLPWLVAIHVQTDGAFLAQFIGHDVIHRASEPLEGHAGPIVYYIPVLLIFFFPWSLLLLAHLSRLRETLPRPTVRFLVCWAVAPVVLFSLAATKLPHYVFPSLPALALLTGLVLDAAVHRERRTGSLVVVAGAEPMWRRSVRLGVAATFALVGVGSLALPIGLYAIGLHALLPATAAVAFALGAGSLALAWCVATQRAWGQVVAACTMMLVLSVAMRLALPAFDEYKRGPEIAAILHAEHVPPADPNSPRRPVLHGFGYAESSLAYYTGYTVRFHRGRDRARLADVAADYHDRQEPMYLLVAFAAQPKRLDEAERTAQLSQWDQAAREVYEQSRLLGTVGPIFHYNTSRNQWRLLELRVWQPPAFGVDEDS